MVALSYAWLWMKKWLMKYEMNDFAEEIVSLKETVVPVIGNRGFSHPSWNEVLGFDKIWDILFLMLVACFSAAEKKEIFFH